MKLIVKAAGVIPTKQYGNFQPSFEIQEDVEEGLSPEALSQRLKGLRSVVENLYAERDAEFRKALQKPEDMLVVVKPELYSNIRWYWNEDFTDIAPSVTSIKDAAHPFELPEGWAQEDMDMFALRGTIAHWQAEMFFKTGEWVDMKTHPDYQKLVNYTSEIIKTSLTPESCNPRGFLETYPQYQIKEVERAVYYKHPKYPYAGRFDNWGTVLQDGDGIVFVGDFKTASSYPKDKLEGYFKQILAYAAALKMEMGLPYMPKAVVFPLNPKNKCGYGAPIECTEPEKYLELWKNDLIFFYSQPGIMEAKARAFERMKKEREEDLAKEKALATQTK